MMKKLFILGWETFLLSRYLDFFFNFFCHVGNRFDKNAKINLKLMKTQAGTQIITIHMLFNISRSKSTSQLNLVSL